MPTFAENERISPVRRSILGNLNNTNHMNDDEAERAQRRRTLGKSALNSTQTNESLLEDQQGLQTCLKIFHDNKINKDNAWNLTIIDNMAKLARNHHRTLQNFQIVGSSLEATTKIYGLRVDIVHSEVLRMSAGLGRMKKNDVQSHDNDFNDNGNSNGDTTIDDQQMDGPPKPQPKKKKAKKQVSTVTKNKESLNGRLEISQLPDSLYFRLNSIMGETSSANKLLLNNLETKQSDLKLTMNDQFWDESEAEQIELAENDDYDLDMPFMDLPIKIHFHPECTLRQQLLGYKISNTPIEDDEDEDDREPAAQVDNNTSFIMSQMMSEYAFDMGAPVEEIPQTENYAIDYDMGGDDHHGGDDYEELTQDDRIAISACKGLRRPTTIIEDLRPSDASKLEYSYRPLDNINQFWAGPSYWKIRKSRKLTMGSNTSAASAFAGQLDPKKQIPPQAQRRKNQRVNAQPIKFITFINDSSQNSLTMDIDDDEFVSVESRATSKIRKINYAKKWDSKKLTLPTDLQIDSDLFEHWKFCPSASAIKQKQSITPTIEANEPYDSDAGNDAFDDGGFDMHMDNGDDMGLMDNMDVMTNGLDNELPISQQVQDSQNIQDQEISQHYEGAPQLVQKIDIQFARRAKVIDMKQMKSKCLETIHRQFEKSAKLPFNHPNARHREDYKEGYASFGIIYNSLPRMLSKTMAENLSTSVAFYSILHLANEHSLRLYKSSNENDIHVFHIRQLNK